MSSVAIVVMLEIDELGFQVGCTPKQHSIEVLAPDGADQPLDEGVRERDVGNGLDFGHFQDPKVGLPLMESIQGIMIGAELFRQAVPANRSLEHLAQRRAVDDAAVDAEANDTPAKLIHHHQNPMSSQGGRLATKQVAAPQAVFGVAEKGQPRRTSGIRFRPIMIGQDPPNHVLVDFDTENQCDLFRDSGTAPTRIPSLHLEDGIDQLLSRALGTGTTTPAPWRKQQAIFPLRQHIVKMQERRRLEHDGGAQQTCPADEEHTQAGHDPVGGAQVRRSFAATVQDQKLVSHENGLGDDAPVSSGLDQADDGDDQMKQKDQEIAHLGNRTKVRQSSDFTYNLAIRQEQVARAAS
jgi:hypothetical protein